MKIYVSIHMILLCLMLQASLFTYVSARPEPTPLAIILEEKSAGNYNAALDELEKASLALDDPASIEVNLFMIRELMQYPELYGRGIEILNHIAEKAGAARPHLADRIDHIRTRLYLSRGGIKEAETIQKSLSFLDFQAMGPFSNCSMEDFERSYRPEQAVDRRQTCTGKFFTVAWFHARPDRTGSISFNELFPETKKSFFYMARAISVPKTGEYHLILGKTGYTDLWLDGRRIFSDRTVHGFCHDQYFIRVRLQDGPHRILIKAGESREGIQLSLRIASVNGVRVPAAADTDSPPAGIGTLLGITFFPGLEKLRNIGTSAPEELFKTGHLLFSSRISCDENNPGLNFLTRIPEGHPLRSPACRYIALAHADIETRDRYLNQSIVANPGNIESLGELADLKISHGFAYEAYPLVAAIKKTIPQSHRYHELMARLLMSQQWFHEAARHAAALMHTPYRSAGLALKASICIAERDFYHAIPALEEIVQNDSFNSSCCRELLECYEKTGRYILAEQLLLRTIALYPNDVAIKLRLARAVERIRGPERALPFFTAALQAAPGNRDVLRGLGLAYHKIGKKDLAVHYLDLACRHDPANQELRIYLETIRGSGDITR